jgi:hypothetical protein
MARILAIMTMCFVALSLTAGTVTHAAEPLAVCLEADVASDSGNSDQPPAGDNKATPHQHGGCHGHHQVAAPIDDELGSKGAVPASLPAVGNITSLRSTGTDPALRPPRA